MQPWKRVLTAAALAVAAASTAVVAQQQPMFKTGTQVVSLFVTVADMQKRLVPDLTQEEFGVFDNEKPQPIVYFDNSIHPINVVVMLDTSGSMTWNLELLKQAAESFVIRLLPIDRARVGNFDDRIYLSSSFTDNRDDLIRVLHNDIQYGNGTRLWDAIDTSMTALAHEKDRRVVLVFTDGDDTTSKKKLDDVMQRAQNEEYMVYAIGLRSHMLGMPDTKPDRGLRKISSETGGGYFELTRAADLNMTFTKVADELHRQYVLGFAPKVLDGKLHKLDVRVKQLGMTARARKSYVATPAR